MKEVYDVVIVIPVGPTCKLEFIYDTIDSIRFYVHSRYKILLSDDSAKDTGGLVRQKYPAVDSIKTPRRYGKNSGLYISLALAYQHALRTYDFAALLRLDTDALIIGHNPEHAAIELFRQDPAIGLAGRHIRGSYSPDTIGEPWDNRWIRKTLLSKAFTWKFFRRPLVNQRLRSILLSAFAQGYELGECIFGGAYVFSKAGLVALDAAGLLPMMLLHKVGLEEDHLFSLLIMHVGLKLGNLSSGDLPFGCAWIGLPVSPPELLRHHKKIIHSTRSWRDMKEADIRAFFKDHRQQEAKAALPEA